MSTRADRALRCTHHVLPIKCGGSHVDASVRASGGRGHNRAAVVAAAVLDSLWSNEEAPALPVEVAPYDAGPDPCDKGLSLFDLLGDDYSYDPIVDDREEAIAFEDYLENVGIEAHEAFMASLRR